MNSTLPSQTHNISKFPRTATIQSAKKIILCFIATRWREINCVVYPPHTFKCFLEYNFGGLYRAAKTVRIIATGKMVL